MIDHSKSVISYRRTPIKNPPKDLESPLASHSNTLMSLRPSLPERHVDRESLAEFVSIAENHLVTLRSYIEGFSPYLDEAVHEAARRHEGTLRFYYRAFKDAAVATPQGSRLGSSAIFSQMQTECKSVFEFSRRYNRNKTDLVHRHVFGLVNESVSKYRLMQEQIILLDFMSERWRWQDDVLECYKRQNLGNEMRAGIRYDTHDDLALWYTTIDYLAFAR